jgi:hypothetical protein
MQLAYLNALGQVEFPYLLTEKSQSIKKVMAMDKSFKYVKLSIMYSKRMLSAIESLPDIHRGKPIAGELLDKGYDSSRDVKPLTILRFNDAFKYIKPLSTHSRTDRELATSTYRGSLGANWKGQLIKLSEEDKVKEAVAHLQDHKYPELEDQEKTIKDLVAEKNQKMIEMMGDQEMRDSVYKLFPNPFRIKEEKDEMNKSVIEFEEEESEEEDEAEIQKEF